MPPAPPRAVAERLQHRRTVETLHDEITSVGVEHLGHRDSRPPRRAHRRRLDRGVVIGAIAAQHPAVADVVHVGGPARADQRAGFAHRGGPGQQVVGRHGVDDPLDRHLALGGPVAAVRLPLELAGGVGVGVDENQQPYSIARSISSRGGSSRSGRQLISTAVPNWAQAANTKSASNVDGGRLPIIRPVQWPRMSTCG